MTFLWEVKMALYIVLAVIAVLFFSFTYYRVIDIKKTNIKEVLSWNPNNPIAKAIREVENEYGYCNKPEIYFEEVVKKINRSLYGKTLFIIIGKNKLKPEIIDIMYRNFQWQERLQKFQLKN